MWNFRRRKKSVRIPDVEPPEVEEKNLFFLIAGQSNASGRGSIDSDTETSHANVTMFANDYNWKTAYEPVDDSLNQVDSVSDDKASAGHSFALRAAKGLIDENTFVKLIPTALGGTSMAQWMPKENRFDRQTLFGSANYRRSIAAPEGLTAVWYYGHEANSYAGSIPTYASDWSNLITEFRKDYGDVPFVFCQLSKNSTSPLDHQMHLAAEIQRKTEGSSGLEESIENTYMVVTFDLPLIDTIHLNAHGQRELGRRISLATKQHVLKENVNGTGPRLVSVTHPNDDKRLIKIETTRPLKVINNNADDQFRVYEDSIELTGFNVTRDSDGNSVLITLEKAPIGSISISYGDRAASGRNIQLYNVVKDLNDLPMPQFGVRDVY